MTHDRNNYFQCFRQFNIDTVGPSVWFGNVLMWTKCIHMTLPIKKGNINIK